MPHYHRWFFPSTQELLMSDHHTSGSDVCILRYDPEDYGVSFVVNFEQRTHFHQHTEKEQGKTIRHTICVQYQLRCHQAVAEVIGRNEHGSEVRMHENAVTGMNNGEMYCWFPSLRITEEKAFLILRRIKFIIRSRPIHITYKNQLHEVPFIGFGIRSYLF